MSKTWVCSGVDGSTGRKVSMRFTAASKNGAEQAAKSAGMVAPTVREVGKLKKFANADVGKKGSRKEIATAMRSLATTGDTLPLPDALPVARDALSRRSGLRGVLEEIREDMLSGVDSKAAFNRQSKHLGAAVTAVFAAGAESGQMKVLLGGLAEELERAGRIRGQYVSALIYPSVVLFLIFGAVLVQGKVVLPQYERMLVDAGAEPPLPMKAVLLFTDTLTDRFHYVAGVLLLLIGFWMWLKSRPGPAEAIAKAKTRLPLFGRIAKNAAIATFSTQMGITLNAGIPVSDCLDLVKPSLRNPWMRSQVERVSKAVVSGVDPVVAFNHVSGAVGNVIPSLVKQSRGLSDPGDPWIAYGVALGEEVERQSKQMSVLIEPAVLLFGIGIVLVLALSSSLAMLQVYQGAGA